MIAKSRHIPLLLFVALLVMGSLAGCGRGRSSKSIDTPTYGTVTIGVDDSYKLLAEAEIYTFQSLYPDAKINPVFGTEADIMNLFLKDSVPLIITNRKLTKAEEDRLNAVQSIPRTLKIAYDAVAFIGNNDNPDSSLYYEQIADIFAGKITGWKQINPKSKFGDLKVVFDNYKSANPRYFREKFNLASLPATCFAVENNQEVINFVEKNKNAIGVISVNWISDREDTVTVHFLKRVKVIGISSPGNVNPDATFYQPYQAYVAEGFYPFTREVYCINRQSYTGLAYGFNSFIAGPQGQLILLHAGLVPATMPVRLVEIKH